MGDRFEKLPRVNTTYENAHEVVKGDPRVDGPYLEEVREREAADLREWRNARAKSVTLEEHDDAATQKEADVQAQAKAAAPKVKKTAAKKTAAKKAPAKKAAGK